MPPPELGAVSILVALSMPTWSNPRRSDARGGGSGRAEIEAAYRKSVEGVRTGTLVTPLVGGAGEGLQVVWEIGCTATSNTRSENKQVARVDQLDTRYGRMLAARGNKLCQPRESQLLQYRYCWYRCSKISRILRIYEFLRSGTNTHLHICIGAFGPCMVTKAGMHSWVGRPGGVKFLYHVRIVLHHLC